jgi:transposase
MHHSLRRSPKLSNRRIIRGSLKLAELGGPRLAATKSELADALHGRVRPHHQFLIGQHLKTIEQLEETITAFDGRIGAALEPFRDAIERLKEVPGLSETSVQILLAEIGTDMMRFPTAGHLFSWAGLVPRLDESAGKRHSTRVMKGAPWLKPVLVQCAHAAAKARNSYPARSKEGRHRRRSIDPNRRLSHAGRRHLLPGSRSRLLRPPRSPPCRGQARKPHSILDRERAETARPASPVPVGSEADMWRRFPPTCV